MHLIGIPTCSDILRIIYLSKPLPAPLVRGEPDFPLRKKSEYIPTLFFKNFYLFD